MGADTLQQAVEAAAFVGTPLTEMQTELLVKLHAWAGSEAVAAGGVGPSEQGRLWDRHIADSIVFGLALENAASCVDIGSGAGFPGLPLAIANPDVEFILVDRSGRRCDLLNRAIAVLGLGNCHVEQADVIEIKTQYDSLVSRAAIPPQEMMIHVKRLLASRGVGLLGLSRARAVDISDIDGLGMQLSLVSIPPEVLDSGANLLRIEAT